MKIKVGRPDLDDALAAAAVGEPVPAQLLTPSIDRAFADGWRELAELDGVEALTGATATADGVSEDVDDLVTALSEHVGRLLFAGWPTGVAVSWSQHHGGPWPATTSLFTSVGATSVRRFQRPLAFQSAPAAALPAALQDGNPLGIPRRVDGALIPAPEVVAV